MMNGFIINKSTHISRQNNPWLCIIFSVFFIRWYVHCLHNDNAKCHKSIERYDMRVLATTTIPTIPYIVITFHADGFHFNANLS